MEGTNINLDQDNEVKQGIIIWIKQESIEEVKEESIEGLKQDSNEGVIQESVEGIKQESTEECTLMWSSDEPIPMLREERETKAKFFEGDCEDTEIQTSASKMSTKKIEKRGVDCAGKGDIVQKLNCTICNKFFSSKKTLRNHILTVHEKFKPFKCDSSDYATNVRLTLNQVKTVHEKLKLFKCPICANTFSQKLSLVIHIESVHEKYKPFKCSLCAYTFSKKNSLTNHVRLIHENFRPFICTICKTTFIQRVNLTLKPYYCNKCAATLASNIQTVYEKIKSFHCNICDYSCGQRSTLAAHIKSVHYKFKTF